MIGAPTAVVLIALLGLGACVVPVSVRSVPAPLPPGVQGHIDETVVGIDLPSAELSLELQEFAGLTLWLSVVPKQRALTLDPNAVGLTVSGEGQRPLSYLGPAEPWTSPRAIYKGCGPRIYDLGWSLSKIDVTVEDVRTGNPAKGIRTLPAPPVEIEKEQCFLFFFDVPSSPGHGYAIDLQGLRADGHAVPLPMLTYEAGKVRKWVAAP